jgi:hypothetical protein
VRNLDSPLVFSYKALSQDNDKCQNNDKCAVEPVLENRADNVGRKPERLRIDSGYVSLQHLEFCEQFRSTVRLRIRSELFCFLPLDRRCRGREGRGRSDGRSGERQRGICAAL